MTRFKFIPKVFGGYGRSLVCYIGTSGLVRTAPDKRSPSDFPGIKTIYEEKQYGRVK